MEKLLRLPFNQFLVLIGVTDWVDTTTGELLQPVTTDRIAESLQYSDIDPKYRLSDRDVREILTDLELLGLVETWIDSRGREGRPSRLKPRLTRTGFAIR